MTLDRDQTQAALPAYEIAGELGRGGWGVVLEARHRRLNRTVAIKQLPRAFGADPAVRARFVAEAQVLASLDHPHIIPVFDYVEVEGLCLLVMEKLPGGTLWQRFVTRGLTMEESCAVVLAACAGLHAAHQRGILHRDVKPDNLMFSASGVLKVTDFGIAKVVGGNRTMATRAGEVLGTPAYMAPEHARGIPLGPPADVYAVGVVLYELLSGRLPFSEDGDALSVLYRHVHEAPVALSEIAPDVPSGLAAVVMRALATAADDRYATAEDLGVAIADAATRAWGIGWASTRTDVAVMGSPAIASALTPSVSPPSGRAPATVASEVVAATATPVPLTEGVRPSPETVARRAEAQPRAEDEAVSLHEIPALPEEPKPSPAPVLRGRRAVLVGGLAVVVLTCVAVLLARSGGGGNATATRSTETTGPEPSAVSTAPPPIYEDSFADAGSGWTQFDTADGRIGYVGGSYLVLVRKPEFRVVSDTELEGPGYRAELVSLNDTAIEVDADLIVAIPTDFGLLCRRADGGEFYRGIVDSTGEARIEKITNRGTVLLGKAPIESASTGRRHLRLECAGGPGSGATLRLLVDGRLVVETADPEPIGAGAAGVVVSTHDRPGAQVLFDNFQVRALP